jgi:hypothetical protein
METEVKRDLAEVMRDEFIMRDKIAALLRDGPKTIVEIAEAIDCPSHEVMLWVMAMWRYGMVAEVEKSRTDEYFQYKLKQEVPHQLENTVR